MFKFKRKNLTYLAVLLCLVFVFCIVSPLLRPATLNILKYPLQLLSLITREVRGIIFYHRNFIQYERLTKEIDYLKHKLNAMQELELENSRLEKLLSLKQKSPYKIVAARVIGRSMDNWSSMVIIDKGRHSGLKAGMVAINYLGLVGRIIEASDSTSKIMLINDSHFAVSGLIQRSRQEGLVSGTLENSLLMRYLPRDADIKIQDTVITSGLTTVFPKGILIGTVVDLGDEFSKLTRYAIIKPALDLGNIEEVLIIIQ